jgi:hypothetical protein
MDEGQSHPYENKINGMKTPLKMSHGGGPTGVVAATKQCANNTMLSWAPYLLNIFIYDSKDTQELGTKLHYSWLIILIALVGWKEPTYSYFCDKVGQCSATRYTSLGRTYDSKRRIECQHFFSVSQ